VQAPFWSAVVAESTVMYSTVNVVLKNQIIVEMGFKDQGNGELSEKEIQIIIIWLLETRRGRKLGLGV
jgi:hypothetical protein